MKRISSSATRLQQGLLGGLILLPVAGISLARDDWVFRIVWVLVTLLYGALWWTTVRRWKTVFINETGFVVGAERHEAPFSGVTELSLIPLKYPGIRVDYEEAGGAKGTFVFLPSYELNWRSNGSRPLLRELEQKVNEARPPLRK